MEQKWQVLFSVLNVREYISSWNHNAFIGLPMQVNTSEPMTFRIP